MSIIRHTTLYIKGIKPIELCGKTVMWEVDLTGAFELPFMIEPTKGEHDYNKCEGCKKHLPELIQRFKNSFNGKVVSKKAFPNCCPAHSKLLKVKEFKRSDFVKVPEMVANKIIYTKQHFINNHTSENWYKSITDYIEYVVDSFGKMPNGEPLFLGEYFRYTTDFLKQDNNVPEDKKIRLFEHLNLYQSPNETSKTDMNTLLSTYESWLKIFPFEISYFANLKQHFEKQLPILSGKTEVNMFTGLAKTKMHTKSSLIDALIELTNNLLTEINGVTLYEKGLIDNANKIKIELHINSRKQKLKEGYINKSTDKEQQYKEILTEWYNDELIFWNNLTPLLNNQPDTDFIRGNINIEFTSQANSGYFIITNGETKRKYTVEKYFDLDLQNWETEIDNANTKTEKIKIANNGIFILRKDWLDWEHPLIQSKKEKNIEHLKHIIEYINANYDENITPKPILQLREIALLCYFLNEKITVGNQDTFALKYQQENAGKKLFSDHYKRIIEDEKEIYQPKYSKKYLENIKSFITDLETLNKIDSFIKKCK